MVDSYPVVLISAPYMVLELSRFEPVFMAAGVSLRVAKVSERMAEADLLRYAGEFDGAIAGDDQYTGRVLRASTPRLKVISKWGTGVDSIDLAAAAKLGVLVRNTPDAFTDAVADSTMSYVLAFARQTPWLDHDMKRGEWAKRLGSALRESTLGVVGVGRIGGAVARRAHAFGMRTLGNDVVEVASDLVAEIGIEMMELAELLAASDYVSINCDLNPTSHHLIGEDQLNQMRDNAVLINTARGAVVDEGALIAALENHQIGGAALDVFEREPLPQDSPLRSMDNVLLAPHNANSSPTAWEQVHKNTIRNLFDGLGIGEPDFGSITARPADGSEPKPET